MTHRLYVDLQAAQRLAHAERGIARYSIELTEALLRVAAPIDTIATTPHLPDLGALPPAISSSPLLRVRSAATLAAARALGPLSYLMMSPMELELSTMRTVPESAIERADLLAAIVYDFIPHLFPERYLHEPGAREAYDARLRLLRQFDLFLALSAHTRRDTIELLGVRPEQVVVIGAGVSERFTPAPDPAAARRQLQRRLPAITGPYVLTVGAWEWRKNVPSLIEAFARLDAGIRRDVQLVVACGLPVHGEQLWRAEATAAGLRDEQFVVTGFVDDDTLRDLYRGAQLFVYPSYYEGFGLPPAEAARCGAPVVTSRSSSLPEILRFPASTFDPGDIEEMAAVMQRGITDEQFRADLLDAGRRGTESLSWDDVARRVVDAHDAVPPRRMRSAWPRVAVVAPDATSARSSDGGLAHLVAGLAAELAASSVTTHLFVGGDRSPGGSTGDRPPGVAVYPFEALDSQRDPFDYDLVVHATGAAPGRALSAEVRRVDPTEVRLVDDADLTAVAAQVRRSLGIDTAAAGPPGRR